MKSQVRTRFAPSPTGSLHIGNLRTAFYAYALAKHNNGFFVLRIEDTDKKRVVEGQVKKIQQILKIFNLQWDEYFVQSERVGTGVYEKAAKELVDNGHAFYCQCEGRNAKEDGFSKILRDPCRDMNLISGAIKLKVPDDETVSFFDFVINKEISWNTSSVPDATLLKTDGYPTYHLAVVVDDTEMNISHVIRGHDWLPSTPIHLLVYKYLRLETPMIGHPTDILDPDGGKLSKRKGTVSVEGMIAEGYLPEAIFNYVILLGWAPKDNREIFNLEEFVKLFDVKGFQKSNPVFDRKKLDWFNGYYIRHKSDEELLKLLRVFVQENIDTEILLKVTALVKERLTKLSDFDNFAGFFFNYKKPDQNLFGENFKKHIESAISVIEPLNEFKLEVLNEELLKKIKENDFLTGEFFMDLRIAITGSKFTPPINESMIILGKDEVIKRLKTVIT